MVIRSKRPVAVGYSNKPMNPVHTRAARRLVADYTIIIEPQDDGAFVGRSVELPGCFGSGPVPGECFDSTRRVVEAAVAAMLESDTRPPAPARQRMRTEQVNIRLTAEEKLILEQSAQAKGFQNLSSFIRSVVLAAVG